MCKKGKEAGTRGQCRKLNTIQLEFNRLMECIRGKKKMLYSLGEIAVCEWETVEMIQKS